MKIIKSLQVLPMSTSVEQIRCQAKVFVYEEVILIAAMQAVTQSFRIGSTRVAILQGEP